MINLPLTDKKAIDLKDAIQVAINVWEDFPENMSSEIRNVKEIMIDIQNALNPMMATGIQSTVQPNERNGKQQRRI